MGNKSMCCGDNKQGSSDMDKNPQNMANVTYSGCDVILSRCYILTESVDCIVLISNTKMKLGVNITNDLKQCLINSYENSQELLQQKRCKRFQWTREDTCKLDLQFLPMLVMQQYTQYQLDCEYIFFAVLPSTCDSSAPPMACRLSRSIDEYLPSASFCDNIKDINVYTDKLNDTEQTHERQYIYECVHNCLTKAQELGIQRIAIPVMSHNTIHIQSAQIAQIMFLAIKSFLKETPAAFQSIRINSSDPHTIKEFKNYLIAMFLNDQDQTFSQVQSSKNLELVPSRKQTTLKSTFCKTTQQQQQQFQQTESLENSTAQEVVGLEEIMHFCREPKFDNHKSSF